jgi:hypothetical protein
MTARDYATAVSKLVLTYMQLRAHRLLADRLTLSNCLLSIAIVAETSRGLPRRLLQQLPLDSSVRASPNPDDTTDAPTHLTNRRLSRRLTAAGPPTEALNWRLIGLCGDLWFQVRWILLQNLVCF